MSQAEQVKFPTGVYFIPSLGIIKSSNATQALNQSEQLILSYLLEHNQRPATKQDLIEAGWPDREVTEASLFQVIRSLRVKLQESNKGEVIETIPRLGYQICTFDIQTFDMADLNPLEKIKQKSKPLKYFLLGMLVLFCAILAITKYVDEPSVDDLPFESRLTSLDSNQVLFIGEDEDVLTDLTSKVTTLYQSYNALHSPNHLENRRIFIYKNNDLYSVAWCKQDQGNYCIKGTELSYSMRLEEWPTFQNYILSNKGELIDTPKIQTDFTRQPAAKVYLNYIDDSVIQSKVIHYFISNEPNNEFKYSSMSFIASKHQDLHHVLSIKAANYQVIPTQDIPNVIARVKIMPEMFHWAYQPTGTKGLNKGSLALENERHEQVVYEGRKVVVNHLLYHHNHLSLIFSANAGLYWVHSNKQQDVLFKPTVD